MTAPPASGLPTPASVLLSPDAGPLISLAYANSLDLLVKPGWTVALADMVLHEVTRNDTPTSQRIAAWVKERRIPVLNTLAFARYEAALTDGFSTPHKSHLGEFAIQELMNELVFGQLKLPNAAVASTAVFLFEDHQVARASFVLPSNCQKVSTRAYLQFLEQKGFIASSVEIERAAISAGRAFSQLKFP